MLPRLNRIPSPEISNVMRYGKRVSGGGITLIYKTNTDSRLRENDKKARFAFIVSTKVDKRATARNRMRRVLSESVRHLLTKMSAGIDGILIGSKELHGLSQIKTETIVDNLFGRAGLFVGKKIL